MHGLSRSLHLAAALAVGGFHAGALAINGALPGGNGVKNASMGGTSIALPLDAVAAANNPAGIAFWPRAIESVRPRLWEHIPTADTVIHRFRVGTGA